MKKNISILLVSTITLTLLTGCNIPGRATEITKIESPDKEEISEIQSREGLMLKVSQSNCDEMSRDEDVWVSTSYEIMWDGTITRKVNYMLSGCIEDESVTLNEEDYLTVYVFAESTYINESYSDHLEQGSDGSSWNYVYCPADSDEAVCLYSGYAYSDEELRQIQDIVSSYFPDEEYYGPLYSEE